MRNTILVKMKRILYISNVPWTWTKQRPQFLAEELSKKYQVTYVQESAIKNEDGNITTVALKHLWHIPFARFRVIRTLNNYLYRIQLNKLCREADIIWFTSPKVYEWIAPKFFNQKKTVYDCMDDMIELYPSDKKMGSNERELYHEASIVLASSSHLSEKLKQRYGQREILIVNNAISANFDTNNSGLPAEYDKFYDKDKTILTYVGSISSWMDFDLLKAIHERFPQITINLWGPPHSVTLPDNGGFNLCGTVEHKYVSNILASSGILIMPFVVNELIESVNPVKLYEYIYSGKPCLAPKYGESMQFKEYVNLYESHEECLSQIERVIKGDLKQKPLEECRAFVRQNTWSNRVGFISKYL